MILEHDGRSMSARDWAAETGLDEATIRSRIAAGWSVAQALEKAPLGVLLDHEGESLPIRVWAERKSLPESTIRSRLRKGWSVARTLDTPVDYRFSHRSRKSTRSKNRACPPLRKHPQTGEAIVRWVVARKRKQRSFGAYGSKAAEEAYAAFQRQWSEGVASLHNSGGSLLVCELAASYSSHAKEHYQKFGKPTGELGVVQAALTHLLAHFSTKRVCDFGPDEIRALQSEGIKKKLSVRTINKYTNVVVRMFAFGSTRKRADGEWMVPPGLVSMLREVPQLDSLRHQHKPRTKIASVPWDRVEAIFPHLLAKPDMQLRAETLSLWERQRQALETIIRFHWLVGMRSTQLLSMRPCDLDRLEEPWVCTAPDETNKNAHRGKDLTYLIGPQARELLKPLLAIRRDDELIFQVISWKTSEPVELTKDYYRNVIADACVRAKVPHWYPHQIRKSRATLIDRIAGRKAAAKAIGDTEQTAARHYIDPDIEALAKIVEEHG